MFQFGAADNFLPVDQSERIRETFSQHQDAEIHLHAGAGHAFDNFRAPIFHHAQARADSWPQTRAFLERHFDP